MMRFARTLMVCLALALQPLAAVAASVEEAVTELQHEWELIKYQTPEKEQEKKYEALAAKAHQASLAFPDRAEPLVWEGIIVSSWAGAKGGIGALGLAKRAKAHYEAALKIRPDVLDGSAYNSLGVLYYKVPGWPVGFGSDRKAQELLQKALAVNPRGIDPNFFYGEFLVEQGKPREAMTYLERALQAPPRPGRDIADAGRREEARKLLEEARRKAS
ncbi:MAG TPA: tetratricopeptide repeat protein [Burkholderiales bacterium]|nr:tetratricopeptide repeat protein [Burkholderiales bacterium]